MQPSLNGKQLIFWDDNNHHNEVTIDKVPDSCPLCEHGIKPLFITSYGFKRGRDYRTQFLIQTVFRCPRDECQSLFLSIHRGVEQAGTRGISEYVFLRASGLLPLDAVDERFGEEIEKLSPRFVKIYNQAESAEDANLDEITGPGFRKSLEILIKDYVIFIKPNLKDQILAGSLGYTVFNHIDNEKIKNMAGLAKDIGNDETHYDKKLEELTIEDLKKLIKLASHWIVTELLTEQYAKQYKELMNKPS